MLDSGSDRDVVSSELTKELGLENKTKTVTIQTVNSTTTATRQFVDFRIEAIDESYGADVVEALSGGLLTSENDIPPSRRDFSSCTNARDITFIDVDAKVEMILGIAHAESWMGAEVRRGDGDQPCFIKTTFGWTAAGGQAKRDSSSITCHATAVDDESLRHDFHRIFNHDFAMVSEAEVGESRENRDAIQQLSQSIRFDATKNKYVIGLPWKHGRKHARDVLNNLDSRQMAMKRLRGMIPRFRRDPDRMQRVFTEMAKFEEKGYASAIEFLNDDREAPNPRWYLPLHVVEKGQKTRICHDGRANVRGTCVNDLLIGTPNLLNSLPGILLTFRTKKIAFMTDISSYFHQILVDENDADAFRYLWFEDQNMEKVKTLRFNAHIFGSGASSLVTSYVLRQHAERIKPMFSPEVYETIREKVYVDDVSGGADAVDEAFQLKEELKEAFALGGFSLAKWKSNYLPLIEGEEGAKPNIIGERQDESTKVLGVGWSTADDALVFEFDKEIVSKEVNTPRELVSVQASLFDPLGLIAPFLLIGRRMLQRSMANGATWDSPLDPALKEEFGKWMASIPLLAKYRIPRWWNTPETENETSEQIHVFSDASTSGYASVAYRRVSGTSGAVHVSIITARSHVIPLNPARASHHNSVPRLELTAAAKSVEIRQFIETTLKRQIPTTMWTDSECVLKQIYDRKTPFKKFVENRLSKIHAATRTTDWRYVDSKRNPADLASRGIQAHESHKWKIFHSGPTFLYEDEENWPKTLIPLGSDGPSRDFFTCAATTTVDNNATSGCACADVVLAAIEKLELWYQRVKRITTLLKVVARWKVYSKDRPATRSHAARTEVDWRISTNELREAERVIFIAVQRKAFHDEFHSLTNDRIATPDSRRQLKLRSSRIIAHNPFIAQDGVIRVGSRLVNALVKEETKFPAILPRNDASVQAFIRATHVNQLHCGAKQTLSETRQRVWILQGLQEVKRIVSKCVKCQKAYKKPLAQLMAPLPAERVTQGAPWSATALDYMGPFGIRMASRAIHKCWVCVFTCMRTRAVHAETVFNLDAASAINAIVRFAARRPGVQSFTSDCGTNLTSADRILKKELAKICSDAAPALQRRSLEWKFIPPGTPHYGGVWERMVSLFKKHLKVVLERDAPHIDVFNTAIIEIESIINKRPLTAISTSSNDYEAITPAHILYPASVAHSSAIIVENADDDDAERMRCSWRRAQSRVNAFWRAWKRDYVTLLHDRSKWKKTQVDMAVGDLVLLVDDNVRRGEWKTGRIIRVSGTQNHVRKAEVRRADGRVVTKDRTKLILLELDGEKRAVSDRHQSS